MGRYLETPKRNIMYFWSWSVTFVSLFIYQPTATIYCTDPFHSCKIKYPGTTTFGKVSDTFQLLFKDEPPPDLPVNQSKCKPPGEPVGSLSPLGVAIALLVVVVVGTMVVLRFFICICCCSNTQRAEDTGKRRSTKGHDQSTVGTEEPEEEDKDSFKVRIKLWL